ncbi:hypothetical protein TSUD_226700 [Trifolium subterraneum]|uniref:Uncharacterized protein n=1 Tax=Trifolium subterraneum TaxID=3900 RepID=A0A2Z6NCE3_TRISU|nr:hypothetical protein TSUD_226700 [Trifolium subterraneum]
MYEESTYESDVAFLESIRIHLLGDSDVFTFGAPFNAPVYCRSSSFNNLNPCLSENWGELPLKEDDSDDMVLYGVLRDAVNVGWVPSLDAGSPESYSSSGLMPATIVKSEPEVQMWIVGETEEEGGGCNRGLKMEQVGSQVWHSDTWRTVIGQVV